MKNDDKPARATIVDVAKLAGVSTMTVTRVIHKRDKVSSSTRERVEKAIDTLGYAPNLAARALVGSKVRRVCLLYGNPSSAYLGELILGALKATSEAEVNLIVEQTDPSLRVADLKTKLNRDWDALIVPPPMSDVLEIRNLVSANRIPAVFLASASDTGQVNQIRIDDYKAAYEITQLLIKKGHRRIGFIKGDPSQSVAERRLEGYRDALTASGLALDKECVAQGLFTYRSGEQAALKLLSIKRPPTAIFASNDDMAAGALAAAMQKGLAIPDDIAIAGFDDSPIATTVAPALTTVRQPVAKMAEQAVQLVLQPKVGEMPPQTIIAQHNVIERETT